MAKQQTAEAELSYILNWFVWLEGTTVLRFTCTSMRQLCYSFGEKAFIKTNEKGLPYKKPMRGVVETWKIVLESSWLA